MEHRKRLRVKLKKVLPDGPGFRVVTIQDSHNERGFNITCTHIPGNTYKKEGWGVKTSRSNVKFGANVMTVKAGSIIVDATGVTLAIQIEHGDTTDRFVSGFRNIHMPLILMQVGGTDVRDEVLHLIARTK